MYKIITIMLLSIMGLQSTFAQTKPATTELSKESKKRIKAELKDYLSNPQKYLADQEEKKNKIKNAEKELEDLKTGLRVEKRDLEYARDSVKLLAETIEELKKAQIATVDSAKKEEATAAASGPADCSKMPDKGVFYKVQLGNFSSFMPSGFNGLKTFNFEIGPKASKRFLAGYFGSFEEAAKFAEDVRRMGIRDAFVAQYQDGSRNEGFDPTKVGSKSAAKETPKAAAENKGSEEKAPAAKEPAKAPVKIAKAPAKTPAAAPKTGGGKPTDNFTVVKQLPPTAPKKTR